MNLLQMVNRAIKYTNNKEWHIVEFTNEGAMIQKRKTSKAAFCSWEEMIGVDGYDVRLEHNDPNPEKQPKSLDELDNPHKYRW